MGNESFDDLLQAFHSALVTAQDSLRIRSEEVVRRRCAAEDIIGGGRSAFYTFVLPQNGMDGNKYEVLPLPVSSFRAHHRPRISMLSLEFECDLIEKRLPGVSRRYSLVIEARNQKRWWSKKRRRMQIVFHGTDHPSGEVRIDGKLLVEIPRYGETGKGGAMPEAKRSIFSKLLDLLRNAWQPQRFTLTKEQSERIREIMGQADAETLTGDEKTIWKKSIFAKEI